MTDNLHQFLRSRRSVRHFKPEPVPAELLQRLLETAIYAPSAHNKQPWRFVVITTPPVKQHLAEAITEQFRQEMIDDGAAEVDIASRVDRSLRRLQEAPAVIVFCQDVSLVKLQPDEARQRAESAMGMQSVAMAGLQLLLAAHAEGLGGGWICWPLFTPEATRRALEMPREWEPQGMVFLGYAAEEPGEKEMRAVQDVVQFL